jgi:hypothetical protein
MAATTRIINVISFKLGGGVNIIPHGILKSFMTIALLLKLERMHKKNISCGNVNPYTFRYLRSARNIQGQILVNDS